MFDVAVCFEGTQSQRMLWTSSFRVCFDLVHVQACREFSVNYVSDDDAGKSVALKDDVYEQACHPAHKNPAFCEHDLEVELYVYPRA